MTKPWDNEPTPTTKQAVIDSHGHWTFELRDRMENLERRLRHAEKLLEQIAGQLFYADVIMTIDVAIDVEDHLKAARQEDGR